MGAAPNSDGGEENLKDVVPVTLLSGFLGSGKTTLVQNVLSSKAHGMKIAVVVNDMAELNIDAEVIERSVGHKVSQAKRKVVKLQNGCICCTLREDLVKSLLEIYREGSFDYVLIESTGIAEPQQVAESFTVDPRLLEVSLEADYQLQNFSRLDTCVSVVDVSNFSQQFESLKRFNEKWDDGLESLDDPEGYKSISRVLVEQVEFANVILLNKIDLVDEKTVELTRRIVSSLNSNARILTCSYGKVDLENILNTGLFSMEEAAKSSDWLESMRQGLKADHGEADEYGVNSFVYKARKPFDPVKLHQFMSKFFLFSNEWNAKIELNSDTQKQTEAQYGKILRSKGIAWIGERDDFIVIWAQAGNILHLQPSSPWFCKVPKEYWPRLSPNKLESEILQLFQNSKGEPFSYGDRRQEIVIIGIEINEEKLRKGLDACLYSDKEMEDYKIASTVLGDAESVKVDSPRQDLETLYKVALRQRHLHLTIDEGAVTDIKALAANLVYDQDAIKEMKALDMAKESGTKKGFFLVAFIPVKKRGFSLDLDIFAFNEESREVLLQRVHLEVVGEKDGPMVSRVLISLLVKKMLLKAIQERPVEVVEYLVSQGTEILEKGEKESKGIQDIKEEK